MQPNFYAIIPADIRFCWASNAYFAELYWKTPETISRVINDLAEKWFFKIFIEKEKWNLRKIYIWEIWKASWKIVKTNTIDKNINSYWWKHQETIDKNVNKIIKDNIKKNNNKISKDILLEKKQKSFLEIFEEKILKNEEFLEKIKNKFEIENESLKSSAENFLIYWTEKNENGKKEKWEKQKTFDIQKRFFMWLNNDRKRNSSKNKRKVTFSW